jgi:hypothetical protein
VRPLTQLVAQTAPVPSIRLRARRKETTDVGELGRVRAGSWGAESWSEEVYCAFWRFVARLNLRSIVPCNSPDSGRSYTWLSGTGLLTRIGCTGSPRASTSSMAPEVIQCQAAPRFPCSTRPHRCPTWRARLPNSHVCCSQPGDNMNVCCLRSRPCSGTMS